MPPNWDSWGKIRVLREGFDVEAVSSGWTADLSIPWPRQPQRVANGDDQQQGEANDNETGDEEQEPDEDEYEEPTEPDGSSVALYEASVQDPTMDALHIAGSSSHSTKLEVQTTETQQFLEKQLKLLDVYKQKNEEPTGHLARIKSVRKTTSDSLTAEDDQLKQQAEAKVLEHIGPVQFNMGGIQVDADDMLQRLKVSLPLIGDIRGILIYLVLEVYMLTSYPTCRNAKHSVLRPNPLAPRARLWRRLPRWTPRTCKHSSLAL